MNWARILAFVTGTVDQELLARIEYLTAENRILKAQLKGRLKLSDAERATLAEIGHRLGRKVLAEVATVARPDTILAWSSFGTRSLHHSTHPIIQRFSRFCKRKRDRLRDRLGVAVRRWPVCLPHDIRAGLLITKPTDDLRHRGSRRDCT